MKKIDFIYTKKFKDSVQNLLKETERNTISICYIGKSENDVCCILTTVTFSTNLPF